MKITINVIFLLLSLSTLSSTATPINLDRVMTTELGARNVGNLEMDRLSIVKRGTPSNQMQKAPQDEAIRLAIRAQQSFPPRPPGPDSTQNVQNFLQNLVNLAEHLQSRVGDQALTQPTAESLRRVLTSWRNQVKSERFWAAGSPDVNLLVAKIATCRNIVEKVLAVALIRPLPDEINNTLQRLDELFPDAHSDVGKRSQVIDALEKLVQHLQLEAPTSWEIGAKAVINAKLLTFRDWVEDWPGNEALRGKVAVLHGIKECENMMHGKANVESQ
ncbi:hypothetical protein H0H93_008254 [Arthromyces matolae]|nr:hypothetical protein H0H93_008254 [Arthromyces matolae]